MDYFRGYRIGLDSYKNHDHNLAQGIGTHTRFRRIYNQCTSNLTILFKSLYFQYTSLSLEMIYALSVKHSTAMWSAIQIIIISDSSSRSSGSSSTSK